jgi:transcriptional regulator with XRE-family HTH domain
MGRRKRARTLTGQLRDYITGSGRNLKELGKESGVDASQLSRFMRGQRGLTTDSLDKLCAALRLKLVPERRPSRKTTPKEEEQ